MFRALNYKITFANEKTISRDLEFATQGSTLITGPNEAGKSLNLEMIAYALFGNEALRGKTTDYKRISCKLMLDIKGQGFEIERTKSNAKLFKVVGNDTEQLAVGITPVNQAVIQLLGFDYDVYKIAHLAAQGDLQALAGMKPTERKAMVDTVAGLNQLDSVVTELDVERKTLAAELKTLESFVRTYDEPTAPARPKAELEAVKQRVQALKQQQAQLRAVTAPRQPQLESNVTPWPMPEEPKLLELPELPKAPETPEEYNVQTFLNLKELMEPLPQHRNTMAEVCNTPALTLDQIQEVRDQTQIAKRQQERERLRNQGTISCESCGHENFIASSLLASYADLPEDLISMPQYTETELARMELSWEQHHQLVERQAKAKQYLDAYEPLESIYKQWVSYVEEYQQYEQKCQSVEALRQQAETSNQALKNGYQQRVLEVNTFNSTVDVKNSEIEQRNNSRTDDYQTALEVYNQAQSQLQAPELQDLDAQLQNVETLLASWVAYDQRVLEYKQHLNEQQRIATQIAEANAKLTDFDNCRKALKQTKTDVKSFLTPALSRVASVLLNEMTGGVRNTVTIDEDFDVVVDNQPLRTLSGSGKDIVNLAIRIALGQVLTHKVLPVMCLDEIDQGMDADRARYTQECLQRITPQVGQMLIVSHRPTVSDHVIAL